MKKLEISQFFFFFLNALSCFGIAYLEFKFEIFPVTSLCFETG